MEQNQKDPLANEILNFSFTVEFTNALLQELGKRPFVATAGIINFIRQQGEPQFQALLAKEKANESQTTAQESGNR